MFIKRQHDQSVEESFRIDYFLYIVDRAIISIENRFEQFQIYENIFGFLFNFTKLKSPYDDSLQKYYNIYYTINYTLLFSLGFGIKKMFIHCQKIIMQL